MKQKSLLTTLILMIGLGFYTMLNTSYSSGFGSYQSGCSCHNPSANPATTVTINGLPTFYNLNTAYPVSVTVANATMNGAGFQIQTNIGSFSSPGSNVAIQSGNLSAGHSSKKFGTTSVTFNLVWNSPSVGGTAATFNAVGNAARAGGMSQAQWNTAATTNVALPVNFISIDAKQFPSHVLINFETSNEENIQSFEIERGIDGKEFNKIGSINPKGNSYYEFNDYKVAKGDQYFYRIKEISIDNEISYSKIVSINISNGNAIAIYPTIVENNVININGLESNKDFNVMLHDLLGRPIVTSNNFNKQLILPTVPSGVYFVTIINNNQVIKTQKVFIK